MVGREVGIERKVSRIPGAILEVDPDAEPDVHQDVVRLLEPTGPERVGNPTAEESTKEVINVIEKGGDEVRDGREQSTE